MKPELMVLTWAVALTVVQMLIAVSGATLLLCVFLLFRPAGRELRENPA